MAIVNDEKFKTKLTTTTSSSSSERGRYVSHVSKACENCRKLKIRCSGSSPCESCARRGKEETCFIIESRPRRGKKGADQSGASARTTREEATIKKESCSSTSSSGNDENGFQSDAITPFSTTSSYRRNEQQLVVIAERLLADESTAKFLIDVFIRRIHPHISNLAPSTSFSLDKIFDRTMKPSDAIQRDAGLAMACRMCGHETLSNLLMKRMEMNFERIKGDPLSDETYYATAMLAASLCGVNITKGLGLAQLSFSMRDALFARKDPIAATCEYLDILSINDPDNPSEQVSGIDLANALGCNEENGMCNDWASVSKEEITAHVQMAVSQMTNWMETLEDPELRFFVYLVTEMDTQIAAPSVRPCLMMQAALAVDLHLLGCLTPPYLMEIVQRHDPESSFGMVGIFKPCAALEDVPGPCLLNEEITASFLRRAFVTRMLILESRADPDVVGSYIATTGIVDIVIQWRSGNREKAAKIGQWFFGLLEQQDVNFWNPILSTGLMLVGSIFFEMGDSLGLMRIISTLDKLRRSQPTVAIGIEVLKELQTRLVIEQDTTVGSQVTLCDLLQRGTLDQLSQA